FITGQAGYANQTAHLAPFLVCRMVISWGFKQQFQCSRGKTPKHIMSHFLLQVIYSPTIHTNL
ncbi:MAG: hypothetical protein KJ914_09475, partial [Gammaproteobacteria bacterium]|nr:hypothetical protein [Gammaproteobacteria bacterium]MBU1722695.1 hypothetical protein [Gammaproteobacteria bacterium]MBU2006665.1 hypothetical protein [Gammaproteobacteria bacterium]